MEFLQTVLDNGLNVVAEVNADAASMAAGFFVRAGSRDETDELAGVSHFLEHMVFKGTDTRSALQLNREFDELGANYNAFTTEENTVFYGAVLPEFQERLLDLLCDMMRPALRRQGLDLERNVILDEIALYQDQPRSRLYDKLMSAHFRPDPLGKSILGTNESITDLTLEQMREYFRRHYSPANILLVGAGKIGPDDFVRKAARMCGDWAPAEPPKRPGQVNGSARKEIIRDERVLREHIGLMSAGPPRQAHQRYAAELLATIVGDTVGSRLFYALVEPAIADEASMAYGPMDSAGTFLTFVSCEGAKAHDALSAVRRVLREFVEEGPSEKELRAAKNKIASAATLKGELPIGRLAAVGFDWMYRHEYVPLKEQIEVLFAVSVQDVHEVARQYRLDRATVVALGPIEDL